ncbi:MAG: M14 family metallopeptidase [Cyclobacteriaceae bacterium]|nr:M14 family metallopeptidase [Cyclobacteriaceae bacterium]
MKNILIAHCFLFSSLLSGQPTYFYPQAQKINSQIPTPEQFLGYPIGTHHTRHDKVVEYFKTLDALSARMTLLEIGKTYEHRPQITAIITSPDNHANLEDIRQKHLQRNTSTQYNNVPLVILLGYNVHGNEPSSTEAAMLTAYYLTASEDEETLNWLKNMVILLDPVYNPDGRDRHSHWANMHKASALAGDPLDREHNEVWPGGRTNHYWFDLNRDWFLGVHPESRNRLKLFHQWRPYVMTDHHEMGTNSTFYFDPGKNSSNNPIVPAQLYDVLYPKFGEYFAKAMDGIGSQYFTKEAFDKLYPGYGSSYVNFYGGAGFLFEQASSRGHLQETTTVPLTFAFTIRNQFTASLATIRASIAERETLINLRLNFFRTAATQAKANPVKGYVFGDANDLSRTFSFVNLLRMHDIEVFDLPRDMAMGGKNYEKGKAFIVPTEQSNYIMVRSAFEKDISYTDSIFYDASTWSLVHAFNMPHSEIRGPVTKGERIVKDLEKTAAPVARSNYAYLIEQTDYQAHKALYLLQQEDVIVKTAFKSFSAMVNGKEKNFRQGTLIIPVQQQTLDGDQLYERIKKVSAACATDVYTVETGYNVKGIDLGSGFAVPLKKINAAMLIGNGVSGYEAGEVWHLLDQRIGMPITKIDVTNTGRVNWSNYNVLVMVSGTYMLDKSTVDRIKNWIQTGGTLITFKTASEWAIKQGLTKEKLVPTDTVKNKPRVNYEDAANKEGARNIGGSIFQVDLDVTNPIGFGYTDRNVAVYRNGLTFLQPSKNPYTTVAKYKANPLIGGYLHKATAPKVANSAAILLSGEGQGRIIMFSDNPNFRGTWYGTNKLFLNALFFGPVITVPNFSPSE